MPRLLKSAIVLGASPLLVGTLIYVMWRYTQWEWLEAAGGLTILVGLVAFYMGASALCRHLWFESRAQLISSRTLFLQAVVVGSLLLANFPVAGYFALSAVAVSMQYTVRVYNNSNQTIDSFIVTGPGVQVELGPIASGQYKRRDILIQTDGTLEFAARQQELEFKGQLEGYITGGMGGFKDIRVKQGGVYEIYPVK
ncbi:hypothetical protein [Rubinisphaera italica]|uniref:Uncharacterized protein n=1 Tax=Rubinisphaera italica TaxID=2527969 RepID=A0A5C5XP16_9PLAN|nr:hypothetical protein [Rubinisphaera italica]TWT64191.1 hypothetical protein Pan54_49520 [Rubinisphaera italica]